MDKALGLIKDEDHGSESESKEPENSTEEEDNQAEQTRDPDTLERQTTQSKGESTEPGSDNLDTPMQESEEEEEQASQAHDPSNEEGRRSAAPATPLPESRYSLRNRSASIASGSGSQILINQFDIRTGGSLSM